MESIIVYSSSSSISNINFLYVFYMVKCCIPIFLFDLQKVRMLTIFVNKDIIYVSSMCDWEHSRYNCFHGKYCLLLSTLQ